MGITSFASRPARVVAFALAVVSGAVFAEDPSAPAAPAPVSTNAVQPGVWTTDFPAVLARARAEHRPLLIRGGLTGCGGCIRMEKHLNDRYFSRWIKDTGIYLAKFHTDEAKKSPEQAAAMNFLLESKFLTPKNIPYICVYWPRLSNDEVRVGFSFQRAAMPGGAHASMSVEFTRSLDILLGDYLKTCGKRPTEDEFLAETRKKIAVAAEGPGTVAAEPEDGLLACGKTVKLTATPAPGCRLTGWKGPDGKLLRGKRNKTLSIVYLLDEGTYTAVFGNR